MHISDWSADMCSYDLLRFVLVVCEICRRAASPDHHARHRRALRPAMQENLDGAFQDGQFERAGAGAVSGKNREPHGGDPLGRFSVIIVIASPEGRSEEHTSELQSLMRISYAVFCLKKTK